MYLTVLECKLDLMEEKIESYRDILNTLLYDNNLTDQIVIDSSRKLDKLLIEYEKIKVKCNNYKSSNTYNR